MANAQASPRKMPKLDPKVDATDTNGDSQDILEEIDSIQTSLDCLNDQASDEILKVEQKYNMLRKPHYKKRSDLIAKIPDFWLNTFMNHPQIAALLDETDEEVLRYMTQLSVEETEDIRSGYKIIFEFKTNPFFENKQLVKEFTMSESGEMGTSETKINWKQGMGRHQNTFWIRDNSKVVTFGYVLVLPFKKSQIDREVILKSSALTEKSGDKGKGKVGGKRDKPGDDPPSFFSWFEDNSMGGDEVGEVIKDDIWANPMQYYLDLDEDEELEDDEEQDAEDEVEGEDEDGAGEEEE